MMRRFAQVALVAAAISALGFAGVAPQAQADPNYDTTWARPVNTPDGIKYQGQTVQATSKQAANDFKQEKKDAGVKASSSPVSYPGPKNPARSLS
jgi:hypothetical protein